MGQANNNKIWRFDFDHLVAHFVDKQTGLMAQLVAHTTELEFSS